MANAGRILGIIGALWVALGLFGNLINVPNVNFFPGIILLFVARVISKQARETRRNQERESDGRGTPARPPEIRRQPPPRRTPTPRETVGRPPQPSPEVVVPAAAKSDEEREEMLEDILLVGRGASEEKMEAMSSSDADSESFHSGQTLSSSEMIAQARRRWNRKV